MTSICTFSLWPNHQIQRLVRLPMFGHTQTQKSCALPQPLPCMISTPIYFEQHPPQPWLPRTPRHDATIVSLTRLSLGAATRRTKEEKKRDKKNRAARRCICTNSYMPYINYSWTPIVPMQYDRIRKGVRKGWLFWTCNAQGTKQTFG
jgi:hypothetical protein